MKLTASYGLTYPEKGFVGFVFTIVDCDDLSSGTLLT